MLLPIVVLASRCFELGRHGTPVSAAATGAGLAEQRIVIRKIGHECLVILQRRRALGTA